MNQFDIEVLPDGKIKVTAKGGFSQQLHKDADEFLKFIQEATGGETKTRNLRPGLGNPQHHHHHGHEHHHH